MISDTKSEADKRARDVARYIGFAGLIVNMAVVLVVLSLMMVLDFDAVELFSFGYGLMGASVGTLIAVLHSPGAGLRRVALAFGVNDLLALALVAGAIFIGPTMKPEMWVVPMIVWWGIVMAISALIGTRLLRSANPQEAVGAENPER